MGLQLQSRRLHPTPASAAVVLPEPLQHAATADRDAGRTATFEESFTLQGERGGGLGSGELPDEDWAEAALPSLPRLGFSCSRHTGEWR